MLHYSLRRLLAAVPVLFGLTVIVFLIMAAIPGDPALAILGSFATPENVGGAQGRPRPRPLPARAISHLAGQPRPGRPRPLLQPQPAGHRRGVGALLGYSGARWRCPPAVLGLGPPGGDRRRRQAIRACRQGADVPRPDRHLDAVLLSGPPLDPPVRGRAAPAPGKRHVCHLWRRRRPGSRCTIWSCRR